MVTTPPLQPRQPRALCLAVSLLALAALLAAPAAAQILKCTDNAGNVVYQNEACPKNTKPARVEIFDNSWTADRAEKDAAWQRQAARREVVAGMPLHWVREALGEPSEVRKTATAGADEVWLYSFFDRSAQVGVLGNQVLWFRETPVNAQPPRLAAGADALAPQPPRGAYDAPRETPVIAPPARAAAMPDAAPAQVPRMAAEALHEAAEISHPVPASPKISESRHGIARGQDCRQALAELGTPDRQREVPPPDSASDPVTEYFYEPSGSASPMRTRIVCANGKVEGVDRTVVR